VSAVSRSFCDRHEVALVKIWFQDNPRDSDTLFEENILKLVTAKTSLLLDKGFYHFSFWLKLIEQKVDFVTRLKKGASIQVEQVFTDSYALRDRMIRLGAGTKNTPFRDDLSGYLSFFSCLPKRYSN
jgi:hypothetical protein